MIGSMKERVIEDARSEVAYRSGPQLLIILSWIASKGSIITQKADTKEVIEKGIRLQSTGVEFNASPANFWAISFQDSSSSQFPAAILLDKRWSPPRIFSRPFNSFGV